MILISLSSLLHDVSVIVAIMAATAIVISFFIWVFVWSGTMNARRLSEGDALNAEFHHAGRHAHFYDITYLLVQQGLGDG